MKDASPLFHLLELVKLFGSPAPLLAKRLQRQLFNVKNIAFFQFGRKQNLINMIEHKINYDAAD
jgi:hypothetical protein